MLKDLGVNPANVTRRAALPEDLFSREASLSVPEYFRLWQAIEDEVGEPTLPIQIAKAITSESFSPMLFACLCSPNLVIAMQRMATYKRLIAPVTITIEERPDGLWIEKAWTDPHVDPPPMLSTTDLTALVQIARMGTRERIEPLEFVLPHAVEAVDAYVEFLGIPPTRGTARGVLFRKSDATLPFLTASDGMWETFEPELRRRLAELDASATLAERVRSALLESLPRRGKHSRHREATWRQFTKFAAKAARRRNHVQRSGPNHPRRTRVALPHENQTGVRRDLVSDRFRGTEFVLPRLPRMDRRDARVCTLSCGLRRYKTQHNSVLRTARQTRSAVLPCHPTR